MLRKSFKKLTCFALSVVMTMGMSITAFANETQSTDNLQVAYDNVTSYAADNGISLDMTFDDFLASCNGQSAAEYEKTFYEVFSVPSAQTYSGSSSGSNKYYYNTGSSCPAEATYSKYNLLDVVQKGDIIYEANGGFGVTGHIAIVEGVYTTIGGKKYIRIIEAIDVGVKRGILDDTRVDDKAVTILRVDGATSTNITNAINFCINQLDKPYKFDLAKDTSSDEEDWYCSELVWAAYKNQGIDIEVSGISEPGITPRDILNSSKTTVITYSTQ